MLTPVCYKLRNSQVEEMHRVRFGAGKWPRAPIPSLGMQTSQHLHVFTNAEAQVSLFKSYQN